MFKKQRRYYVVKGKSYNYVIFKYDLKYDDKKKFISDPHSLHSNLTFNDLMLWLKTKETESLPQTKIVQSIILKLLKGCEYKLRRKVRIVPTWLTYFW